MMKNCLVLVMAVFCISAAGAYDRVFSTPVRLDAGEQMLDTVPARPEYLEMNYRVRVPSNRERSGKALPAWEVVWNYLSPSDYCGVALTWCNSDFGAIDDRRFLRVELFRIENGVRQVVASKDFEKKVNLADGYNSVTVTRWEDRIYVAAGASAEYLPVGEMAFSSCGPSLAGLIAHRPVEIVRARLTAVPYPEFEMAPFTESSLKEYLSGSHDELEGIWSYFDRKTDPEVVVPGGSYTLAIVKTATPDTYNIIYLAGAEIHSDNWPAMRVKGRLSRTGFVGNYNLEWLDADGHPVSSETYAYLSDGALLSFRFPLIGSELRFRKLPLR